MYTQQASATNLLDMTLVRHASAPSLARQAVRDCLGSAHPALDLLMTAISELVTNAVVHADRGTARRWVQVLLAERDAAFLRVSVIDPGTIGAAPHHIPMQRTPQMTESGRGLAIIHQISSGRWGDHLIPGSQHRLVRCDLPASPTDDFLERLYAIPE